MTIRRCIVCQTRTSEPETCSNCGQTMCPACHEEHGGYCSEECMREDQYYQKVDYEYDRMMDR